MKPTDEVYQKLYDLWWDVLSENKDVTVFETEFKTIAMDDGFDLDVIEDFWRS